ncbi:ComF family protein [Antrihabitans sp. YC2-6]|uniref:ComF family protein n=1 Tax=Antrihabitans sp. YC2-6 TaxID=2799498 RepID=UPI0018F35B27|nr:phosphoribosyltransferase family protein [Antrihabitans sp. YC2-6]MBJ8347294.1 ComF family protein [Antrihabitans sp. YC2-6]
MQSLLDLILPLECGGCGAAGSNWCAKCREALAAEPMRLAPRSPVGVACWALGNYSGPHRRAVISAKERGRRDLAEPLGMALAAALGWLRAAGELDPPELAPLILVPAPTRARAARVRGGDPVFRAVTEAARFVPRCRVAGVLVAGRGVKDSVGLSVQQRQQNLVGRVHVVVPHTIPLGADVVLVDDVLTTGSTARESVGVLATAGVKVTAALVVASA